MHSINQNHTTFAKPNQPHTIDEHFEKKNLLSRQLPKKATILKVVICVFKLQQQNVINVSFVTRAMSKVEIIF
jgi:hypothetical protein